MSFNIPNIDIEIGSCLYKLFCGEKYVIVKGKNLAGSLYLIERGYATFIAGGGGTGWKRGGKGQKEWEGKNTFYLPLYRHIRGHPTLPFRIEIILEHDNGYQLLKHEQLELNHCFKDKKCLNTNLTSYIPQYRKSSLSYGWISKPHVLNFKKFLKNI